MAEHLPLGIPDDGKLAENIALFGRALRKAGLSVGPGQILEAVRAVETVGFSSRQDFYYTLRAVFVSRPEHRQVFHQVFKLFWRDPRYLEHMMSMMMPAIRGVQEERRAESAERRAGEALLDGVGEKAPPLEDAPEEEVELEIDASRTASAKEVLRQLDFEQMSGDEMRAALRVLAKMTLPVPPLKTRRRRVSHLGTRADWTATMRRAARTGGEFHELRRAKHREHWPNLVVICDISGSMSAYSRAVLHFLHAVVNEKGAGWSDVHAFTFGTRLTNITRALKSRDVDAALAAAGTEAQDWQGGTRIGECLHRFNRDWSRRVLGRGAVVVLITDGLERGDPDLLDSEAERLALSCRQFIWINPLLRWEGFAPRARGIRALLRHVTALRSGHNIASLQGLADAIGKPSDPGEKTRLIAALE